MKRLTFSIQTVLLLAYKIICLLEDLHSKKYVCRQLDLQSLAIGNDNKTDELYFLHCYHMKKYIDPETGSHVPYREVKGMVGDPIFAALN